MSICNLHALSFLFLSWEENMTIHCLFAMFPVFNNCFALNNIRWKVLQFNSLIFKEPFDSLELKDYPSDDLFLHCFDLGHNNRNRYM